MTSLRDPFETIHKKPKKTQGGTVYLDYVSWSQVADRLDDAAPDWAFQVLQFQDDWVLGRLTIGNRIFDNFGYAENADAAWKSEVLKDAASDALKRCAAMAGVGRYLYDKDAPTTSGNGQERAPLPAARVPAPAPAGNPPAGRGGNAWKEGDIHEPGHKALRANAKGLYCPTKIDGEWCQFRTGSAPKAHPLPPEDEPPPLTDDDLALMPF